MSQLRRYRDRHEFFTKFIFDDVYFLLMQITPISPTIHPIKSATESDNHADNSN